MIVSIIILYILTSIIFGLFTYFEFKKSYQDYKKGLLDDKDYMKVMFDEFLKDKEVNKYLSKCTDEQIDKNIKYFIMLVSLVVCLFGIPAFILINIILLIRFFKKKES